ncbi:MAG TPA: hypothetical protein DDW78_08755 [Treponema sp.]|nr:hypothetical protein [Treponema sp.]
MHERKSFDSFNRKYTVFFVSVQWSCPESMEISFVFRSRREWYPLPAGMVSDSGGNGIRFRGHRAIFAGSAIPGRADFFP